MQRSALADQSHINTINQADAQLSDIWNAVIKNVNTASSGEKESLSGGQIKINRMHSRESCVDIKKVIPVTGDRGIVLVLRGEFGLAKKPRSTSGCPSVNHDEEHLREILKLTQSAFDTTAAAYILEKLKETEKNINYEV